MLVRCPSRFFYTIFRHTLWQKWQKWANDTYRIKSTDDILPIEISKEIKSGLFFQRN